MASRGHTSFGSRSISQIHRCPRTLVVTPTATASPEVKADDTAEARRRLARQFRKHKLEPHTGSTSSSSSRSRLTRPQLQLHQQLPWQQQQQSFPTYAGPQHALQDSAAAEVARELLEWQFQLDQEASTAAAAADDVMEQDAAAAGDDWQLPDPRLPGLLLLSEEEAAKLLTKAIMRASHWRRVQSLIEEHEPGTVNVRHLAAALTRMVYLQATFSSSSSSSTPGDTPSNNGVSAAQRDATESAQAGLFLQKLYAGLSTHIDQLEYRQGCNVLWAAGKLHHTAAPSQHWLVTMLQHTRQACSREQRQLTQQLQADEASAQQREALRQWQGRGLCHAGQVASALVSLQHCLPQEVVQDTLSALLSHTRDLLQEHITQHQPLPQQRSASKAPQQQQQQQQQPRQRLSWRPLPARDLANLAASLALLRAQPSPSWLSAYAAALGCRGLVYCRNYRDLSQLLWATAVFSQSTAEGSAAAHSVQVAAAALMGTAQAMPLSSCDGQALANTLWALATLGQRPPLTWLDRVLRHSEAAANGGFLNAQGLSNVLWALAALAVVPPPSCLAALLAAAQQQFRHMTSQGFSIMLWSLAVLERAPSRAWLAGFWPCSRALLPQMTSQGLVNCLWAAARLGLQPPQEWVADLSVLLLQRGVGSLTHQGVANVVWALSTINISCRAAQQLLQDALSQAQGLLVLQQQQQQQQQSDGQQLALSPAEVTTDSRQPSGGSFNITVLSGLINSVCHLQLGASAHSTQQQQQQQQHAEQAGSTPSSSTQGSGQLTQLTGLLQEVSAPLMATASNTELSVMLWSLVRLAQAAGSTVQHEWMGAWFAATRESFSAASSRDLAQWLWCLATWAVAIRPDTQWLASWQVASFRQLGSCSPQDLANMLWALAALGITPEPAWMQQCMQEVTRRQLQRQLEPQHTSIIAWALAKMGHRPDRYWTERFMQGVFWHMPRLKPQELSNTLWAMASLNMKVPEELLWAAVGQLAAQLSTFKVSEVAVSLWALARLKAQPDLRVMGAALQHCFSQARQLTPTQLCMLMWSVSSLRTPPPKAWVAKLLVATHARMSGFSAKELSMMAVSLARLEYRPADAWLDAFAAAAAARMDSFGAQALANILWGLTTLHYTPSEAWMNAVDAQLARHVHAFSPAHVAMTLWALSRLQWLPAQPLLQQLQERAELHSATYVSSSQRMLARALRVLQQVESEDDEQDAVGRH